MNHVAHTLTNIHHPRRVMVGAVMVHKEILMHPA